MGNDKNLPNPQEIDTDEYIKMGEVTSPLLDIPVESAIKALQLPSGSRGLDAGCGIGLHVPFFANIVGPTGHVTGLDICPKFLMRASEIIQKAGLSQRVAFQEGDVRKLPFSDNTFDWAWSANCVGYGLIEAEPALREMVRVVKPQGTVAILIWSSEQLLPGYPLLEARLGSTSSGIAPFTRGKKPELHFLRALGWFHTLGIKEPTAQTFAGSAHAPLRSDIREALRALIEMRWPNVQSELTAEDWAQYQRICQPESPDYILNLPDYYAFFTYSLFRGRVVK